MIEVFVGTGDQKTKFYVHQDVVIPRSVYFEQKVKTTQDSKTEPCVVLLPSDYPNTFRRYLNLVYADQLITKDKWEWHALCRLFILAERLQDVRAKNQIIDGMQAFFHELILSNTLRVDAKETLPAKATTELYERTRPGSQARKLVVDLYANSGNEGWLRGEEGNLPMDFVYDVAVRLIQQRPSTLYSSSINRPSKWYHEGVALESKLKLADSQTTSNAPALAIRTPQKASSVPQTLVTPPDSAEKESSKPVTVILKAETTPQTPRSSIFGVDWKTDPNEVASRTRTTGSPVSRVGKPTIFSEIEGRSDSQFSGGLPAAR